jgi:hypothetical protein
MRNHGKFKTTDIRKGEGTPAYFNPHTGRVSDFYYPFFRASPVQVVFANPENSGLQQIPGFTDLL